MILFSALFDKSIAVPVHINSQRHVPVIKPLGWHLFCEVVSAYDADEDYCPYGGSGDWVDGLVVDECGDESCGEQEDYCEG
jgi:hypothetical protein